MNFLRRLFGRKETALERDEDRFARSIVSALHERDSNIQVEYDSGRFELVHVDDGARGQRMFLHNSFAESGRLLDEEKGPHLKRIIDFIIESRSQRPTGDAALDKLLPVVRPRADTIGFASTEAPSFMYNSSSRVFCDHMMIMLALDSETSIAILNDESLAELGVSFDDALGIAIVHLSERLEHMFGQIEDGIFVSNCGDHYDASRVLMPYLFEQLPLKGNPIAIVQSRSSVLITGSDDLQGLEKIARIVLDDFPQQERAVSITPIELKNGEWSQFEILPHHPQALRNLKSHQLCWSCNATSSIAQQILGDEIYVANPMLVENEGSDSTIIAWGSGVATACPLVDAVGIQEDETFPQIVRRLEDVLEVCGPFTEMEEMPYPLRWLLPARMSDEQRRYLNDNFLEYDFHSQPPV